MMIDLEPQVPWTMDHSINCADCGYPGLRIPLVWNATNPKGEPICKTCDRIGTLVKIQAHYGARS